MAFYDTAATFDSGLLYDQAIPTTPLRKMAKVKLELKSKSDGDLNAFAKNHITKMTGNANFTAPDPDAATLQGFSDEYDVALADANAAQQTAKEKTAIKETKRAALETGLSKRGKYVDLKSDGVPEKIISAGFDIMGDKTPAGVPAQVSNLSLTAGDNAGEIDAQWDPVVGGKITYEIQTSLDPMTPTSWTNQPRSTKSKSAITGLTSGSRVWIRVRATNSAGEGAWSDPATKIVP